MKTKRELVIIGGGLAGCECAWQLAKRGIMLEYDEDVPALLALRCLLE